MYNPMELYKNFWPARGFYTKGLYTKNFFLRIYAQKAAPGLHKGKNRRFKENFILHLRPERKGDMHERVIHDMSCT